LISVYLKIGHCDANVAMCFFVEIIGMGDVFHVKLELTPFTVASLHDNLLGH